MKSKTWRLLEIVLIWLFLTIFATMFCWFLLIKPAFRIHELCGWSICMISSMWLLTGSILGLYEQLFDDGLIPDFLHRFNRLPRIGPKRI